MLCKHRLPITVWFSSPRDQSVLPNANGSLPLGQETSYAAREAATVRLGSGGCLGHTRRYWSLPSLKEKCPLHFFAGQRHQAGFDTRGRAARTGRFHRITGFNRLARTIWPRGRPTNPSKTQREQASAADTLHSNRRRPVWSLALSGAPSRLREAPTTATLGLSPRGPGCPFRPASFAVPAPHLGLSVARSSQKSSSWAGRQSRGQGSSARRTSLGPGCPDSPYQVAEPQTHSRHLTTQPPPTHGSPGTLGSPGTAHWSAPCHVTGNGCHRPSRSSDVTAPAGAYWPGERHVTRAPPSPRAGAPRLPAPSPLPQARDNEAPAV